MSTELLAGEEPLALTREHWSVIAAPIAGGVLVLLAAVMALVLLPASVSGLQLAGVKLAAFAALSLVGLAWCAVHYLQWRMTTYLLTDRRIIAEGGVLSRYADSVTLDRIQNTVLRRPLADRLLGAGEIEIQSAGRDGVEVMRRIPHASQFYTRLMQAIQDNRLREQQLWASGRRV